MSTVKKLLRIFLCAQILIAHNYTLPVESDPPSVIDIALLPIKIKTLITYIYDINDSEDLTEELHDVYIAIQKNQKIVSHAMAKTVAQDLLNFLHDYKEYFENENDYNHVISYLDKYLADLNSGK